MIGEEDDDRSDEQLCEWCHSRKAEEEHMLFGLGRLRLCGECARMLLASMMESG